MSYITSEDLQKELESFASGIADSIKQTLNSNAQQTDAKLTELEQKVNEVNTKLDAIKEALS